MTTAIAGAGDRPSRDRVHVWHPAHAERAMPRRGPRIVDIVNTVIGRAIASRVVFRSPAQRFF
jgi:hypothetical protein